MKGLSNHYLNQLSLYCLKDFSGVFPCDFLTEKKSRTNSKYIVNLDASDNPGSHFVAISVRGHNIFYFDSFALPCTNKYILQAVIESKKQLIYSISPIQSITSMFCGYFCLSFLILDEYNIKMSDFFTIV